MASTALYKYLLVNLLALELKTDVLFLEIENGFYPLPVKYSLLNLHRLFIIAYPGCCIYEPRDCDDVRQSGSTESGVYSVTPEGTYTSFDVYCDMTSGNESWLVSFPV